MFRFASHRAGVASNALPVVYNKSVFHLLDLAIFSKAIKK
jgi:hypothetical protein